MSNLILVQKLYVRKIECQYFVTSAGSAEVGGDVAIDQWQLGKRLQVQLKRLIIEVVFLKEQWKNPSLNRVNNTMW